MTYKHPFTPRIQNKCKTNTHTKMNFLLQFILCTSVLVTAAPLHQRSLPAPLDVKVADASGPIGASSVGESTSKAAATNMIPEAGLATSAVEVADASGPIGASVGENTSKAVETNMTPEAGLVATSAVEVADASGPIGASVDKSTSKAVATNMTPEAGLFN